MKGSFFESRAKKGCLGNDLGVKDVYENRVLYSRIQKVQQSSFVLVTHCKIYKPTPHRRDFATLKVGYPVIRQEKRMSVAIA